MEHVIFITGLRTTEMVLCGWGVRCDGCRVWHAKLAFLTVAALMIISRTVTADAENHRNSEGLEIYFQVLDWIVTVIVDVKYKRILLLPRFKRQIRDAC